MPNEKPEGNPEAVKQEMERIVDKLRDQLAEIHQTELPPKEDPPGEAKQTITI
jgi:hypothetical protein